MSGLVRQVPGGLLRVEEARAILAECKRVDEAKKIRDQAEAIAAYLKRQQGFEAAQNDAAEIKLRAERRLGELLRDQELKAGRPAKNAARVAAFPTLREQLGTKTSAQAQHLSKRWQDVARVPADQFEAYLKDERERLDEVTRRALLSLLTDIDRAAMLAKIAAQAKEMEPLAGVVPCPIIYADPPWQYGNTAGASAVADEYPTMSLEEICALPVPASPSAALFLWATSPLLPEALTVIGAWGFSYKGSMIWDKGMGTGNWVLNCHEFLLIAVRGDMPCPAAENRPKSVIQAPRGNHSAKPDMFADLIMSMYPQYTDKQRFEMFARGPRPGFTVWGNQAV